MNRHEKPDRPAKERDPGRNREIMPEEGQKIMCQIFEDLAEERAMEEKKATARRMITRGKPTVEEIAENVDLPIDIVRDLAGLQLSK